MSRLTKAIVAAAQPRTKPYILWDADLKGFGLKVTPTGKKVFVVQYRMGGRKTQTRRWTIGEDGSPWKTKSARAEAERILHEVGLGRDPRAIANEINSEGQRLTFEQFGQYFLTSYGEREWAPKNFQNQSAYLSRWIYPVIGRKPIKEISRRDITSVLDGVPNDKPALPRNLFVLTRRIFSWAIERGDLERSPMNGMKCPKPPPERHHILAHNELIALAAYAPNLGKIWGSFIYLLLLTGQRLREAAEAEWSEFDRHAKVWKIPAARTKNGRQQILPLSVGVIFTLNELAGVEASETGASWPNDGYLFTHNGNRPISGFSRLKRRLDKGLALATSIDIQPWRFHDLRRTVATNMQQLGVRFEVTEAILNHVSVTQSGVASVYHRHDWLDEKRLAMEAWCARLSELTKDWDGFLVTDGGRPTAG